MRRVKMRHRRQACPRAGSTCRSHKFLCGAIVLSRSQQSLPVLEMNQVERMRGRIAERLVMQHCFKRREGFVLCRRGWDGRIASALKRSLSNQRIGGFEAIEEVA